MKMKKLLATVLAAVMTAAMSLTAMAASVEVKPVIDGEKYTAYKILNYTTDGKKAFSYFLTAAEYDANEDGTAKEGGLGAILEAAGFHFTQTADGTQYYVNNAEKFDAAAAAESLAGSSQIAGKALDTVTATGKNGRADFANLGTGFYFITTSAGSFCALHDDNGIATLVEKNTITTHDKKQATNSDADYTDDQLDLNIGDTVYYSVDITIGKGANQDIILTDIMDEGLTFNEGSITVDGIDTAGYEVNETGAQGFKLTLLAAAVKNLQEGAVVTVQYEAVINEKAVIRDEINNKARLEYSHQTATDTNAVKTYDIDLMKMDGKTEEPIAGAKFNLFTQEKGGEALTFAKDDTGYYKDAEGEAEIDAGDGTGVNIRGLAPGDYWLEETVAPDGYNKLPARVKVTVTKDAQDPVEVYVANEAGIELPATGGTGTTLFYIIGSILVIGAGIVLVAKKRMNLK